MLPPGHDVQSPDPEVRLRSFSHSLWSEYSTELREVTGIDNGFSRCGSLELPADTDSLECQLALWQREGIATEKLDRAGLDRTVPALADHIRAGVFLPEFAQVRNPRHLKSLVAACQTRGVEIVEFVSDLQLVSNGAGRVSAQSRSRRFEAEQVCITAGSWSASLLESLGVSLPVTPVRGQMVQLKVPHLPFTCVIERGRRYIVPRADGLILVGSTEERVGFEKRTTAEGIAGLIDFARSIVPELGTAEMVRSWAGLRPGSPDDLPFIGRIPDFANLFVGAGHFRSGLQMSPGTGSILADLILGRESAIDPAGLTVDRRVVRQV